MPLAHRLGEGLDMIVGLRRESLEFRKRMCMLHPVEPFSGLYLHCRRECLWMVKGCGLHVDDAGEHRCIAVEQPAPAVGAETAHGGA